jgi:hypothetical protein
MQTAGQSHDIKVANRCFENVAKFRYLGTTITNQTLIQEELKKRLNSGKASYHSAQNLLSCLLSKTSKLEYTNYNFACGSVWVRNLVYDIKGGT